MLSEVAFKDTPAPGASWFGPSPSVNRAAASHLAFPSIRAGRMGAQSGRFRLRPVPEFKELKNAGTTQKWLFTESKAKGRN